MVYKCGVAVADHVVAVWRVIVTDYRTQSVASSVAID